MLRSALSKQYWKEIYFPFFAPFFGAFFAAFFAGFLAICKTSFFTLARASITVRCASLLRVGVCHVSDGKKSKRNYFLRIIV